MRIYMYIVKTVQINDYLIADYTQKALYELNVHIVKQYQLLICIMLQNDREEKDLKLIKR